MMESFSDSLPLVRFERRGVFKPLIIDGHIGITCHKFLRFQRHGMEEAFFNGFFQFCGRLFTIGFHIQNPNIFGFLPVFSYSIQIEASPFDFDGEGREVWADSWVSFALLGKGLPFMKGDDGKEGRIGEACIH